MTNVVGADNGFNLAPMLGHSARADVPAAVEAATPRAAPYPALGAWQDQVRRGQRRIDDVDALWRAAAWERAAQLAERDGDIGHRDRCITRAREVVAAAVGATA